METVGLGRNGLIAQGVFENSNWRLKNRNQSKANTSIINKKNRMTTQNQTEEWKELKSVLKEVEAIFTDNDLKEIIEINQLQQTYATLVKNRIKDARDIIKEMSTMVAKKEQEIVAPTNVSFTFDLSELLVTIFWSIVSTPFNH